MHRNGLPQVADPMHHMDVGQCQRRNALTYLTGSYSKDNKASISRALSDTGMTGHPSITASCNGSPVGCGTDEMSLKTSECRARTERWTRNIVYSACRIMLPSENQYSEERVGCDISTPFANVFRGMVSAMRSHMSQMNVLRLLISVWRQSQLS